ncbi:unnamed protein product [Cyclocybe aegerita]|uniref:Fungal lipase-type domain-containing protein n=1 Tax=Cyclocybe aegerita TaxID=1973307 RepID=A0A8S0WBV0_CYCAE|nr:unnamed protein product [Cyclocybe aegerita]
MTLLNCNLEQGGVPDIDPNIPGVLDNVASSGNQRLRRLTPNPSRGQSRLPKTLFDMAPWKSFPSKRHYALTEEQRRMYASEKLENFRWISKLVATYSSYILTDSNLASDNLYQELAELGKQPPFHSLRFHVHHNGLTDCFSVGQFAEMAYSAVPIHLLLEHYETLSQPGYPLENYDAVRDAILIDAFRGTSADLPAYVAYRPDTSQLIVSISGTSSVKHALQDLRAIRRTHPSGKGAVHSGFWVLYQGIKTELMIGIRKGLAEHPATELILTGHSMGGSISYLLCLDLLTSDDILRPNLKLKIAAFGAPRTGDAALVTFFRELVGSFRQRFGGDAFKEYSVKGYNDGVPALPPAFLGYRHFCAQPIFTVCGKLYQTPATESEHALFHVHSDGIDEGQEYLFPKGGHNYYNGRDLERFTRRINWLDKSNPSEHGWEARYLDISVQRNEMTPAGANAPNIQR